MSKNSSARTLTAPASQAWGARNLAYCALLAALSIVFARLIIPMPNETTRFSIEAVPIFLAGLFFGPVAGGLVGFSADLVGCLFSGYGYNPAFSVPPILIGLCAGLLRPLLYRRVSYLRVLASFLPAVVLGSMLWQSYWLSFFYGGRTFLGFLGVRSIQFAITSVVNAFVVFALFKSNVLSTLHLWPPVNAKIPAEGISESATEAQ